MDLSLPFRSSRDAFATGAKIGGAGTPTGAPEYWPWEQSESGHLEGEQPIGLEQLVRRGWADDSGLLLAISQEDEGGPELDSEAAPQALTFAVFHPAIFDEWMRGARALHQRSGLATDSAPISAELQYQRPAVAVHFFTARHANQCAPHPG